MRLLGVDPGFTGALAIYDTDLGILEVLDMPCRDLKTDATVKQEVDAEAIRQWLEQRPPIDLACVEKVASRPGQGVATMYGFGEATGTVIGALVGMGITTIRWRPQEWQRRVKLKGGEHVKDHSRDKAVMLFPAYAALFGRKRDSGRSDATLIAYALTQ
jgi:Holliday junction resolvasome RuvABC endonuclease subunit